MQKYQNVAQDALGNIVQGMTVSVFFTGTQTLAPIFSDNVGTVKVNPTTTDSLGNFFFYVANGRYDVQLTKAGLPTTNFTDILIYDSANPSPLLVIDNQFTIENAADNTKQARLSLSGLATGVTRIFTLPNLSAVLADLTTLAATTGAPLVGVIQTLPDELLRTTQNKPSDTVCVSDFGANTVPGTTDMTAAFAAVALIGGRIYVPASGGPYLITDTVLFAVQRTTIIGDGQQRTIIKFAPTTTGKPCFHFKLASASTIAQGGVRGMAFDATGNTQGTKSAIRVTDGEEIILRDIAVSNWSSAGHDCIGVPFWSRQTHEFSDVTLFADIPISIETNPNISISIDHYHFFNCSLSATANPFIVIADGVNLTQVTFDGYQAWVGGTYGLFWNDTTTAQSSNGLTLKNVRTEQGTSVTAYAVSITHNTNMQGLVIDNCNFAPDRRGFFFRKVFSWHIKDSFYSDPAKEALNIDSSTSIGRSSNTFWQTGATATITGLTRIFQFGSGPNATLASDFCYMNTGSTNPALMAFLGTSGATNAGSGEVG